MPTPPVSLEQAREAVRALEDAGGSYPLAAQALQMTAGSFDNRIRRAKVLYKLHPSQEKIRKNAATRDSAAERAATQSKIDKLTRDLSDYKAINDQLRKEQITTDKIKEILTGLKAPPLPPNWTLKPPQPGTTGTPSLLWSDWHHGEVVDPRQMNGVNAFNQEIAERRIRHLVETTINLCLHHISPPKYDKAKIMLGGDMINGLIHEELEISNYAPIGVTLLHLRDLLIWAIEKIADRFGLVEVECIPGNHGRIHRKPRAKNAVYDSFEWFLYQYLLQHFKNEKSVFIRVWDSPMAEFAVYGTRYLLVHGDQFKGGTGISGALSPLLLGWARLRQVAMATNRPFDVGVCGHWHTYIHLENMIVNSSLKGYDEWTKNVMKLPFEPPSQALWITHPTKGITFRMPVFLESRDARF